MKFFRAAAVLLVAVVMLVAALLLSIKISAYRSAIKADILWDAQHRCALIIYRPDYRPYGVAGRLLSLFSNHSFFVVEDPHGRRLRSSAWYFWQFQFSDLVYPEWQGGSALYPTSEGWDGWYLAECG